MSSATQYEWMNLRTVHVRETMWAVEREDLDPSFLYEYQALCLHTASVIKPPSTYFSHLSHDLCCAPNSSHELYYSLQALI